MRRIFTFILILILPVFLFANMKDDFMAALNGKMYLRIRTLLNEGANLEMKDDKGRSPLISMVMSGNLDMVRLLLSYGANVDTIDNDGYTALHHAVKQGELNIATVLIEAGAETNSIDNKQETPVYLALKNNDIAMTELLIKNGGELNYIPKIDPIMEDYLKKRVSIRNKLYGLEFLQRTDLMKAVFAEDYKKADLLIHDGADVNEQNDTGLTALMMAAGLGDIYITRLLIQKGADQNITDKDGLTALSYAMLKTDDLVVKALLENDSYIDPDALFYALFEGKKDNLSTFLNLSNSADVTDEKDRSLLMYASYLGDFFAVRHIIDKGANLNLVDDSGLTALAYCVKGMRKPLEDYYQIASKLVANGALKGDLTSGDPEMAKALKGYRQP